MEDLKDQTMRQSDHSEAAKSIMLNKERAINKIKKWLAHYSNKLF